MAGSQTRELPSWAGPVGVALALVAMVAWSFAQRWDVLGATPFPLGVDGYFYPVQLRSLLEHGELQYPASPLAFYLLAPFAAATDPITGAKIGAALYGALVALPAYAVGARLGRDPEGDGRGPGLVAAALAVSSSGSMYLSIEFVKNGIGLTVALVAIWLVLRCFDAPTRWRIAAAALGVIAAVLTHKVAAALVLAVALPAAWAYAQGRLRGNPAHLLLLGGMAGVGALLVAGSIAPRRLLSSDDLGLLDGVFSAEPRWSLPMLGDRLHLAYEPLIATVLAFGAAVLLGLRAGSRAAAAPVLTIGGSAALIVAVLSRDRPVVAVVALVCCLVGLGGGALLRRREISIRPVDAAAWVAILLALFIGLPWLDVDNPQGLGMRLRAIAFVPLALCAAVVLRAGLPLVMRTRTQRLGACVALAAVAILARVGGEPRTEGQVVTHPALVAGAHALAERIPAGDTAIVPERHIAFMVAWYARTRISIRPEPVPAPKRWRVINLAFIRRTSAALDAALIAVRAHTELPRVIGLHPSHPNGLVLVPERTWEAALATLPAPERARLEAWPTI